MNQTEIKRMLIKYRLLIETPPPTTNELSKINGPSMQGATAWAPKIAKQPLLELDKALREEAG